MERICPFLALGVDHRTVVDGYDLDHACHARTPPVSVDRGRQAEACLVDAHRQCEFYRAFLAERAETAPAIPLPAADTHLARTRLVFDVDARRPGGGPEQAAFGMSPGRWLVAGGIAAVGVAAAATAAAGGFGPPLAATPTSSGSAAATATAGGIATALPTAIASSTQATSPEPTVAPSSTPRPRPTEPVVEPTPRSYVVQEGDTLSTIATEFGTSVSALQTANGLGNSDVINIGQVLIIP